MNRKHYLLTVALALVAGSAGHFLYGTLLTPQGAEARAASARYADVQWEYCSVTKAQPAVPTARGGAYWINYFKTGGVIETEWVETGPSGNAFAKAVAKLGEQGWDMVGEGPLEVKPGQPGGTPTVIFFKRRKD
jgi:hypothetical protein